MTYLDNIREGGHWEIDPAAQLSDLTLDQVIADFWDRGVQGEMNQVTLDLVLTGALELARRTNAPLAQCLETSMIWCYG